MISRTNGSFRKFYRRCTACNDSRTYILSRHAFILVLDWGCVVPSGRGTVAGLVLCCCTWSQWSIANRESILDTMSVVKVWNYWCFDLLASHVYFVLIVGYLVSLHDSPTLLPGSGHCSAKAKATETMFKLFFWFCLVLHLVQLLALGVGTLINLYWQYGHDESIIAESFLCAILTVLVLHPSLQFNAGVFLSI